MEESVIAGKNIEVLVRVRPLVDREGGTEDVTVIREGKILSVKSGEQSFTCQFDAVLPPSTTQTNVFDNVKDVIENSLNGYNSTLFAYGQTGSGKTFTLMGPDSDGTLNSFSAHDVPPHLTGVLPRLVVNLFDRMKELNSVVGEDPRCEVFLSVYQIYNENIYDLLQDPEMDVPLKVRENRVEGIFVEGISEFMIQNANEAINLLRSAQENRAIRSTHMNQFSSRSHTIFQFFIEQKKERGGRSIRSKLNVVDLAGSEKWNMAVKMEGSHITEMTRINLSLHTLGRVISALSKKHVQNGDSAAENYVPYRDSILTRLLQDSLGGNTKTKLIATISPSALNTQETVSTLKFADCAKRVMNVARINQVKELDKDIVNRLEEEIKVLTKQVTSLSQENERLRNQFSRSYHTEYLPSSDGEHVDTGEDSYSTATVSATAPKGRGKGTTWHGEGESGGESDNSQSLIENLRASNAKLWSSIQEIMKNTKSFFNLEIEEADLQSRLTVILNNTPSPIPQPSVSPKRLPVNHSNSGAVPHSSQNKPSLTNSSSTPFLPKIRTSTDDSLHDVQGASSKQRASLDDSMSSFKVERPQIMGFGNTAGVREMSQSLDNDSTMGTNSRYNHSHRNVKRSVSNPKQRRLSNGSASSNVSASNDGMVYRVRDGTGNVEVKKKEDNTQELEKELKELYQRIEKHKKVAEYAALRKQREEERLQAEQEMKDAHHKAELEKQKRWLEHNRKQKLKINKYYNELEHIHGANGSTPDFRSNSESGSGGRQSAGSYQNSIDGEDGGGSFKHFSKGGGRKAAASINYGDDYNDDH